MALQKVGALWLAEKDGKKYFRGTVNEQIAAGSKVFVYRNTYKTEEKHPDYTLHVAVDENSQERPERREEHSQAPPTQDEIPFAWIGLLIGLVTMGGAQWIA
jgi:hypothetical protein